jgi:hypothetical protein
MALSNAERQKIWYDNRRRERSARAEADAVEYIETLTGTEQAVAIQRLVTTGALKFVAALAQAQRRERLRELRASGKGERDERELSTIARIEALRKARGLDVD